jgi:phosphopantothenoylcysteine decarboxylase/phosphopantothenate--cysteine ligase
LNILITAGPTREAIDPVRFLSNRSSGKMGYALAEAAVAAGHEVTLVSGPVGLAVPDGVSLQRIESAEDMAKVVQALCDARPPDIAIHAAAVADYRPRTKHEHKIKKQADMMTLELERTPDVLGSMRSAFAFTGYLVGFAAETENLVRNAMEKLQRKGCDLVIANDVSRSDSGFESEENEVILCHASGQTESLPKQPKRELAREIIGRIQGLAREKLMAGA